MAFKNRESVLSCFGVLGNSIDALFVEIDDTFLVAFAQNLYGNIFCIRL